jgi:hypothetical protein
VRRRPVPRGSTAGGDGRQLVSDGRAPLRPGLMQAGRALGTAALNALSARAVRVGSAAARTQAAGGTAAGTFNLSLHGAKGLAVGKRPGFEGGACAP